MLFDLKLALIRKGIRQTRMAVDLGWDPAKLSRIINETITPSAGDRVAIARHLNLPESRLFQKSETTAVVSSSGRKSKDKRKE